MSHVPGITPLPDPESARIEAASRAQAGERPLLPARVLVCDRDHAALVRSIEPVTGPVAVAPDLEEALRMSAAQPFEVAFIGVPEHTEAFVGLLQLLRRAMPRTPIILVLEDPSPAARLATLAVRPFYVAVPPVSCEELDTVLADALAMVRRAV